MFYGLVRFSIIVVAVVILMKKGLTKFDNSRTPRELSGAADGESETLLVFSDTFQKPTKRPTRRPSRRPRTRPTARPTKRPTHPTLEFSDVFKRPSKKPTKNPTNPPTKEPTNPQNLEPPSSCFSVGLYNAIDNNIARIKNRISDDVARSHFLGGIVRLAAHDFMDFDGNSPGNMMGSDGCFDPDHPSNRGLESIWCETCELTLIYNEKFSHISRADFWIAAANAVIRQTSVNRALNMRNTFLWGRKDADSCPGSGDRIPTPVRCSSIEDAFLKRMGLDWRDAAALMGAHSLGRGDRSFSGHHGTWVDNDIEAQIFDKSYYEEIYLNAWRPRDIGGTSQDWTRGNRFSSKPQMMLNTDMCLVFDVEQQFPCCSRTDLFYPDGTNQCIIPRARCRRYAENDSRRAATEAVIDFLGGRYPNSNNVPFYAAFEQAWNKATTKGWNNLSPLVAGC